VFSNVHSRPAWVVSLLVEPHSEQRVLFVQLEQQRCQRWQLVLQQKQ
jgi:hypothetical protein